MGKNISKAIKTTYKGRKFQSRLEQHLFQLFDDAGVKIKYEEEVFTIIDKFHFPNASYEKTINSKGTLVNKGEKTHLAIKYTPDFTLDIGDLKVVIECKGIFTDRAQMVWKLFKRYIAENNLNYILYMPRNQKQNEFVFNEVMKLIK
jgi:predicted nuclease of restriction endonuclease-like RecB superfamily